MAGYLKQGQALHEAGQVPGTENLGSRQKRAFRQFENAVIGGMFNTMEATSRLTAYIAAMDTFLDGKDGNVALDRFNNLYEDNQLLQAAKNENGGNRCGVFPLLLSWASNSDYILLKKTN